MSTALSPTAPALRYQPGRITRALLLVFGPAQLGDPNEPPPRPWPPSPTCPRCHSSMDKHTYVQTPERKRLRCPV